ncbi:hypothetical protein ACFL7M_03045 [Thermodesulfobacteriota bacterium]
MTDNGNYRPDATAWAVLALASVNMEVAIIDRARSRLKMDQDEDGRVNVQKGFPAAYWPTALASLAWQHTSAFEDAYKRSINFLLSTSGYSFPKEPYIGHDTTIQGWPWIEGTHSWVEPTALAFLALKRAGYEKHNRVTEALQLILDRQLPKGGWNYGNTYVYGQEFRPLPYSTGMLLYALEGSVDREQIQKSIGYISKRIQKDRTPLSLGWEILGLRAWDDLLLPYETWLMECWRLQDRYGDYNTSFLSIILIAHASLSGSADLF